MKKKLLLTIVITITFLLCAAILFGGWFAYNHVFIHGKPYRFDLAYLDLTDKQISVEEYEQIRAELPDCTIDWRIPFQGKSYPESTSELTVSNISQYDMRVLTYFHSLEEVDATACRDSDAVYALQQQFPDVKVKYSVYIDNEWYPYDISEIRLNSLTDQEAQLLAQLPNLTAVDASNCTDYDALLILCQNPNRQVTFSVPLSGSRFQSDVREITLTNADFSSLNENLHYLPRLEQLHIIEPDCNPQVLIQLCDAYPDVHITWEKTVFDMPLMSDITELDLSNRQITTQEAEEAASYFPNLEKLIMSHCGIDNETMAAFRDRMRPSYKVVWTVTVSGVQVRTDDTIFHSSGRGISLVDERSYDLFYCEDMIVVDIGHSCVKYVEWLRGMPNLKYLILADNWLMDITPIGTCKNLVYLELFINDLLQDISPLVGCTALEDLSVANTYVDVRPLAEMPWLKNLWINNNPHVTAADVAYLQENLPNTFIYSGSSFTTSGGWRQLQNYYDMRGLMGLPCNAW